MSRPLRLAITGCGAIGSSAAHIVRWNPRMKAVYACDRDERTAKAFSQRHRIHRYGGDYGAMLREGGFDAVYLAVPHHLHHDMILAAVEAGLPVLAEKPVTRTLAEGRAVTAAAALRGVKTGVNYQHRYNPGCYALAMAVRAGNLGTVHSVRVNIPWHRESGYFENSPWHGRIAEAGGGTLITQGSHFLDIVLWALRDNRPKSVMGYTARRRFRDVETEDLCQAVIEMESGALLQISSTMAASPEQGVTIEVYGESGTAVYRHYPLPHTRFRGVRAPLRRPPVTAFHPMQASFEGFRRWVADEVPFLTPAEDTLTTLAVVEAVYASARSGVRTPVDC